MKAIRKAQIITLALAGCFLPGVCGVADSQVTPGTAVSLAWQETGEQIAYVESESGDLWDELLHHGPAVENPWVAYRIYFDGKMGVDVYHKRVPGLELATTGWYLPDSLKGKGYGQDEFYVQFLQVFQRLYITSQRVFD